MLNLRKCGNIGKRAASIFAMSSGSLPAALAIVRISGPESEETLRRLTGKSKFEPSRLFYSPFYDQNRELIDRGMAVYLKGPNTFTGEDTVELYTHGSRAVVSKLLSTLGRFPSLTPAKAGEFTKRAFMNSKLDIAQVESLADLLHAESPLQLRLAHRQNEAVTHLQPLRDRLIDLRAQVESAIDFAEDVEDQQSTQWRRQVGEKVDELRDQLSALLTSTNRGVLIRRGIRIALVGRTNVGKSSLINRLAERDVAIVSNLPGTTRDSLETRIFLNGNLPATISDTAGLRTTTDELESEGIIRTIKRANEAHVVVFVISVGDGNSVNDEVTYLQSLLPDVEDALVCVNKSDLISDQQKDQLIKQSKYPIVLINTLTGEAVSPLVSVLTDRMGQTANEDGNDLILSRERHLHCLERAIDELDDFRVAFDQDIAIAAEHLQRCTTAVGEITGAVVNETILTKIFTQFCIGK